MTRIDYYILPDHQPAMRRQFAYRLIQQVLKREHQIFVYCQNENEAQLVSQELWQLPNRFLPNKLLNSTAPDCAIEIGFADQSSRHSDVLINLSHTIAPCFSHFQRVSEIVVQDEQSLPQSRQNYQFYQQRHYPLFRHDLRIQKA